MTERAFTVESVLLCDDIRREDNGKAILIGVYSGDIVVPQFPAVLRLSLWLQGTTRQVISKVHLKARVTDATGHATSEQDLAPNSEFKAGKDEPFIFAIGVVMAQFNATGALSILVQANNEEWTQVMEKKIVLRPGASPEG